ncbi:flagellar basal body-associated FliL family protein [Treponema zioleckii]|uniref:flagellar basal body-associated FliL family protein n=1 Tax=Treponema zioleckii TaxID=331680 RepID=UPI00168B79B7|nr:flagellar basal body-associated FliL family protein [Treponema zioleckii]
MTLNKILIAIAATIFIGIIAGTAVSLVSKKGSLGNGLRKIDPTPEQVNKKEGSLAFNEVGKLRISTKSDEENLRAIVVVSPWLQYEESDTDFYEEMDRKLSSIKSIFNGYFSSRTKAELLAKSENSIKTELLDQVNSIMVLGKVKAIYFNELQYIQ